MFEINDYKRITPKARYTDSEASMFKYINNNVII